MEKIYIGTAVEGAKIADVEINRERKIIVVRYWWKKKVIKRKI